MHPSTIITNYSNSPNVLSQSIVSARLNMLQVSADKPDLLKRCFTSSLHHPAIQSRPVMKVSVLLSLCDPGWKSHQFCGCILDKITFNTAKETTFLTHWPVIWLRSYSSQGTGTNCLCCGKNTTQRFPKVCLQNTSLLRMQLELLESQQDARKLICSGLFFSEERVQVVSMSDSSSQHNRAKVKQSKP